MGGSGWMDVGVGVLQVLSRVTDLDTPHSNVHPLNFLLSFRPSCSLSDLADNNCLTFGKWENAGNLGWHARWYIYVCVYVYV